MYADAARDLAVAIASSGYRPDVILAIARGGMIIAGSLAYALKIKNLYVINVEYYTGVDTRLEFPVILPPPLELVDLADARILVADDVADTGHTLALVRESCATQVAEVRCAVLYQKPASVVGCDYVWKRTDRWIDFPWSAGAALVDLPWDQAPARPSPS
jgi:hypoxanthine phosphoribosyltransferase